MKVEENLIYENQDLQLSELKKKILEYDQKLQLRNRLIKSLKDELKILEKNNNELLESIEFQSIKKDELNSLQKEIKVLKKAAQKQNDNILLFEKKNIKLNNQIQILKDTINTLLLQKNEISMKVKNLQNNIIDKDNIIIENENKIIENEKIIENLKDKIHH